MSVGKESLKRAASAAEATPEVNDVPEVKAEEVKATEVTEAVPASAEKAEPAKKVPAKKTTRTRKTTGAKAAGRKTTAKKTTKSSVKKAVLTPENSEEIQEKFVSGEKPVYLNEELPVYLL